MTGRQVALDPVLTSEKPVHRPVQLLPGGIFDAEFLAEGVGERFGSQATGGGQLGAGIEDPGEDHGGGQRPFAGAPPVEELLEAEATGGAEDSGDMAVGPGAEDGEGVGEGGERDAALEQGSGGRRRGGRATWRGWRECVS